MNKIQSSEIRGLYTLHYFAKDTVFVYAVNSDRAYLVVQILALGIDFHIVGSVAGVEAAVHFLKKHGLGGADEILPVGKIHFCGHGNGPAAPVFLGGIVMLAGHLVRRGAGTAGVGENVHIRKAALLNKRKALVEFFLRLAGEGHDHIRGDGAAGEIFFQKCHTFIVAGGVVFALHPRQNGIAATLHG